MTCSHCAASVRRALLSCPGVASVEVALEAGRASVSGEAASFATLRKAIEELGYGVEPSSEQEQLS